MAKLTLEKFLPYRLNRLAAIISHDFRRVYGPHHDLTIPEWRVLATLGEFEQMTAKAIGDHSSMHKTKVSRAVQALEDRRWLTRAPSKTNRREEYLRLTTLGKQTYSDIVPRALDFEAKIFAQLDGRGTAVLELLTLLEFATDFPPKGRRDV